MAAHKTSGKRASYGAEIDTLLADYRAVVHQAPEREIVRDAIRHFIKARLDSNEGLKFEFDELRRKRLVGERAGLHVVASEDVPSAANSPSKPSKPGG
jgi:hypothetical protein